MRIMRIMIKVIITMIRSVSRMKMRMVIITKMIMKFHKRILKRRRTNSNFRPRPLVFTYALRNNRKNINRI